jgi:hypothetical protein
MRRRTAIGATVDPREPLHLRRLNDEGELVDARGGELVELQVLEQVDAADDRTGGGGTHTVGVREDSLP